MWYAVWYEAWTEVQREVSDPSCIILNLAMENWRLQGAGSPLCPQTRRGRWWLMVSMTEEQKELVPSSSETISSQETYLILTHHYC